VKILTALLITGLTAAAVNGQTLRPPAAHRPPVIKGTTLGSRVMLTCNDVAQADVDECLKGNYSGEHNGAIVTVKASVVVKIEANLRGTATDAMVTAFEKFGAPTKTLDVPYHNAMGATWTDTMYTWVDDSQGTEVTLYIDGNPANPIINITAMTAEEAKIEDATKQSKPEAF